MLNTLVVVYRESFEAILVVGILFTYLQKKSASWRAFQLMWIGVAIGLVLSFLLAVLISGAQNEFQGKALQYFNYFILALAVVLMTQMCIWMKRHARSMKTELQQSLEERLTRKEYYGIALLSCLAVAREGSETVIFLQGIWIDAQTHGHLFPFFGMVVVGIIFALITFWIFNRGFKFFKQSTFFKVTTFVLFLTASALALTLTRTLIQDGIVPALKDPLWDSSWLIDERSRFGQIFSSITGYESTPALMTVLVYFIYWGITCYFYFSEAKKKNN